MKIYADNAATTRVSDTALAAMTPCFQEIYGNPSSLHTPGQRAAEKLAAARAIFARNLHADPREITFTSGGSEADNQALRTAAALGEKRGKRHIVSTKFEHHAVLHTLQALEREDAGIPTQKKLAELLHVSPATVANSLKSLERGGYVRKEADPADARCNRVFLTDRGRRAVQECAEVFDAVDQQVLRGFSPGELEQLRSFHQRMLDNLRQIGGDCTPCCPAHSPFSNGKE